MERLLILSAILLLPLSLFAQNPAYTDSPDLQAGYMDEIYVAGG